MATIKVGIVDCEAGNMFSVKQACTYVGMHAEITSHADGLSKFDALILPGVGAFGKVMENLNSSGMANAIKDFINSGKPLLGICLGMQLLFTYSEEFGEHKGLNVVKGKVVKITNQDMTLRVPHIGWNRIHKPSHVCWDGTILGQLNEGEYMYFIHSYYALPEDEKVQLAITRYGELEYCSAIQINNIFAVQFHPEKSGAKGIKIYDNLLKISLKQL